MTLSPPSSTSTPPPPPAANPSLNTIPINQSLLSGLNFGVSPGLGMNVHGMGVPPTAIYYGGAISPLGLTALPYGGVVGLGGMGLGAPIMVAGPSILSMSGGNSNSGGGGAFSFVGDTQPNSVAGTSGDGDPFSFVKIQ